MIPIIIEGALFVALIATVGALFVSVLARFTPLGVRWRQIKNRRLLERQAASNCPVHGPQAEHTLVRLRNGQTLCPLCYQEILDGKLD